MSINDFRVLNPLGKGAFASVSKVERKSDKKIYALKRVNISKMSKREVQDAVNEIRILASVRHPHIVSFLQAFLDKGDTELCIIMEYCGCGDLAQKVDRYKKRKQQVDERVIWAYLIQMCDALKSLHAKNIVHRDLKTANCFLSEDGTIKIGDLNVSKSMKNGLLQTQIGTPYYMSPEIWANRPYDAGSDMWALGCTLYELAALRPPFLGDSFPQLKRAIQSGRYPAMPRTYSTDLIKVIGQLIRVNPRERPNSTSLLEMPEVARRRDSEWFNKLPSHQVVGDVAMLKTIQVPHNVKRLAGNLPQPCYPDARPHSPEAWPATDRTRADAIEQKQKGGTPLAALQPPMPSSKAVASTNPLMHGGGQENNRRQSSVVGNNKGAAEEPPQQQQQPRRPLAPSSRQPNANPNGGHRPSVHGGGGGVRANRPRGRSPPPSTNIPGEGNGGRAPYGNNKGRRVVASAYGNNNGRR